MFSAVIDIAAAIVPEQHQCPPTPAAQSLSHPPVTASSCFSCTAWTDRAEPVNYTGRAAGQLNEVWQACTK